MNAALRLLVSLAAWAAFFGVVYACAGCGGALPARAEPAVESRFSLIESFDAGYGVCDLYEVKLTSGVRKNVLVCDAYHGTQATVLD